MEKITVEELIKFKMLPFDVFNESGEKLINAGEILGARLLSIHNIRFLTKQQTGVIDFDTKKEPNTKVATGINVKKFKKIFFESLKKMP